LKFWAFIIFSFETMQCQWQDCNFLSRYFLRATAATAFSAS